MLSISGCIAKLLQMETPSEDVGDMKRKLEECAEDDVDCSATAQKPDGELTIILIGNVSKSSSATTLGSFLGINIEVLVEKFGRNRGYAYGYADQESLVNVMRRNGVFHFGQNLNIEVVPSNTKARFVVRGLRDDVSDTELVDLMAGAVSGFCSKDQISGEHRGFGFVDFPNLETGMKTMFEMNGKTVDGMEITMEPTMKGQSKQHSRDTSTDNIRPTTILLVRNLSFETTTDTLMQAFYGNTGCRVVEHHQTKRSKGFGFVQFSSIEEAIEAKQRMSNSAINGRNLDISFIENHGHFHNSPMGSQDRPYKKFKPQPLQKKTKVNVRGISFETTSDMLYMMFPGVVKAEILMNRETGKSKGQAVVEFETEEAAAKTVEFCNGQKFGGRHVFLELIVPELEQFKHDDQDDKPPTDLLLVKNLAFEATRDKVMHIFPTAIDCRLPEHHGKIKGFAFLRFNNVAQAVEAKRQASGQIFLNRPIFVTHIEGNGHFKSTPYTSDEPFSKGGPHYEEEGPPTSCLLVKNVSTKINKDALLNTFSRAVDCRIPLNLENGMFKGFAFLRYSNIEEAVLDRNEWNRRQLEGRILYVTYIENKGHFKHDIDTRENSRGRGGSRGSFRGFSRGDHRGNFRGNQRQDFQSSPMGGPRGGPRGGSRGGFTDLFRGGHGGGFGNNQGYNFQGGPMDPFRGDQTGNFMGNQGPSGAGGNFGHGQRGGGYAGFDGNFQNTTAYAHLSESFTPGSEGNYGGQQF